MNPLDMIDRISKEKRDKQGTEFIAPPTHDKHLISIRGLVQKLSPNTFVNHPLAIWRVNGEASVFVRPANEQEVKQFVNTLPSRKGIVTGNRVHVWSVQDCPNNVYPLYNLTRFKLRNFDFITAGYSGTVFYVVSPPERSRMPHQLRTALTQEIQPEELQIKGLTPEMKSVYSWLYGLTVKSEEELLKERINEVMKFTGAKLEDLQEEGDELVVKYNIPSVDTTVVSRVHAETFQVTSAGVCLSGGDQNYHLQTLIPVIEHGYKNRLGDW